MVEETAFHEYNVEGILASLDDGITLTRTHKLFGGLIVPRISLWSSSLNGTVRYHYNITFIYMPLYKKKYVRGCEINELRKNNKLGLIK